MKRYLSILLILVALLLSACATIKPVDKIALLRAELARWQNFSADGVVRATYGGLTLHKMFVLDKTAASARLDLIDGGAFGISPSPLVSVYLADYLALESTFLPQLQNYAQALPDPSAYLALLADPESTIGQYGQAIADSGSIDVRGLRLTFSPLMQLQNIRDLSSGAELSVDYSTKGDPDTVVLSISKNTRLELLVDNISYGGAETVPLPRKEADGDPQSLLELLKGITVQP